MGNSVPRSRAGRSGATPLQNRRRRASEVDRERRAKKLCRARPASMRCPYGGNTARKNPAAKRQRQKRAQQAAPLRRRTARKNPAAGDAGFFRIRRSNSRSLVARQKLADSLGMTRKRLRAFVPGGEVVFLLGRELVDQDAHGIE